MDKKKKEKAKTEVHIMAERETGVVAKLLAR